MKPLLSEVYLLKGKGDDESTTKWMLEVKPDVMEENYDSFYRSYISNIKVKVLLHSKNMSNLATRVNVSILNTEQLRDRSSSRTHTFTNESSVEMLNIKWTDFEENSATLMPNGNLTIVCDLTLLGSVSNSSVDIKEKEPTLRKSLEILSKDLNEVYQSKAMSDVQIKCGDKTFDAHQLILAARSPVFSRMLLSEMKEKTSGVVNLKDTNPDVVSELLDFIYTGNCCINDEEPDPEVVCGLLMAADKYEMEHLKEMCQYTLSSSLTVENSVQVSSYSR